MIDASGHHLVCGSLQDHLSGAILRDTDDERIRQNLNRLLVEESAMAAMSWHPGCA